MKFYDSHQFAEFWFDKFESNGGPHRPHSSLWEQIMKSQNSTFCQKSDYAMLVGGGILLTD